MLSSENEGDSFAGLSPIKDKDNNKNKNKRQSENFDQYKDKDKDNADALSEGDAALLARITDPSQPDSKTNEREAAMQREWLSNTMKSITAAQLASQHSNTNVLSLAELAREEEQLRAKLKETYALLSSDKSKETANKLISMNTISLMDAAQEKFLEAPLLYSLTKQSNELSRSLESILDERMAIVGKHARIAEECKRIEEETEKSRFKTSECIRINKLLADKIKADLAQQEPNEELLPQEKKELEIAKAEFEYVLHVLRVLTIFILTF
eukprot:TRINITY_DN1406_c1_g1_i1.p1 TRINITY_DN1406_c1_g1~~TRINITY_DN1406_c1_g1_i1.p1  ORF type:complete len:269 (-),score=96.61 TRINITY_DN1406_c1_g1_i1:196-1002(-)